MSDIILETKGLTKHYGGVHALNDANFTLHKGEHVAICLLYTSPSPRDRQKSRMPSSA